MEKRKIIEELARAKCVESIVANVCKCRGVFLFDLSQMVYLSLLNVKEERIRQMYESGTLNAYIVGIVRNQFYSDHSDFHIQQRKFSSKSEELDDE